MSDLSASIERVQRKRDALGDVDLDKWIEHDSWLDRKLRPKPRPTSSALKKDLEDEFLTPPRSFSASWLNRLQQRWDATTNYADLCELAPTQTRTTVRFTREGLEGRVTGYREVTVPADSATAKNSTSILRKPANRAEFVRGAAGFFPFAPGGLDGVKAVDAIERDAQLEGNRKMPSKGSELDKLFTFGAEKGLLEVAPGFQRGLDLPKKAIKGEIDTRDDVDEALASDELESKLSNEFPNEELNGGPQFIERPEPKLRSSEPDEDGQELDDLIPIEFPALEPRGSLLASSARGGGHSWAHVVDISQGMDNFQELVPEMAKKWPFELDTFQKEAVYHLENGDSVFVAAHTSAGKTVVAEYAIALAAKHMTKAIYTSPIKALSNQKFRDFRNVFDDVGILTGDVQISPEASCLIMTTEILRSMLYRGADLIRDVEFVIFDEVHYVNDLERGVVWEEVIIMLPEHVTLILLSATVPNTHEFASWVGRTKKKNIYVISTPKRPVPLEHYLWAGKEMHKIVDSEKRFIEKGWKAANDILSGRDKTRDQKSSEAQSLRGGFEATNRTDRGPVARGRGTHRGDQQQRGRGQSISRSQGNIARTGRGGGRTSAAQDRNVWVHLVSQLRKDNLLPCCVFVFSKKRCEENADSLSNQDFCSAAEKSAIHMIIEKSIARLKSEDRILPQIRRLRELLGRGVAVHHGGLLPIIKEIVEILFAKTLVKVLFATETFAMGLNLPTRTVVFSGYRKHDGREFRNLLAGEYTQMAGRAGRRGIDTIGSVIIVSSGKTEAPPAAELRQMILGDPTKLRSQFRLTYNMILNLLRVEALKIEEMIKRSFSENATQTLLPQHVKQVALSEANLNKIKREDCKICDKDLSACHEAAIAYKKLTAELHISLLASPVGKRLWSAKRLIVFSKNGIRTTGILLRDGIISRPYPHLSVLEIQKLEASSSTSELLPYLPKFRPMFSELPTRAEDVKSAVTNVSLEDVECVTATVIKEQGPHWLLRKRHGIDQNEKEYTAGTRQSDSEQRKLVEDDFTGKYHDWKSADWNELDWDKVKDLHVRELLAERRQMAQVAQQAHCLSCPQFLKHFGMQHDEWLIRENIQALQQLISDQNLQLLPDYEQRIAVLKDLKFIDEESRVELKGKVACEIHSADELVLTELILENVLADFEPEEIVALLSAFVFQEKTDVDPALTTRLEKGKQMIVAIAERVNRYQILHQVILSSEDSNDFVSRPRFGLVEVVYEWARGMSFNRITDLTDVMEGTIVRVITRLDETCREVKSAAKLVGDPTLYTKMQEAQESIKRDVIFAASLYM